MQNRLPLCPLPRRFLWQSLPDRRHCLLPSLWPLPSPFAFSTPRRHIAFSVRLLRSYPSSPLSWEPPSTAGSTSPLTALGLESALLGLRRRECRNPSSNPFL